MMQMDPDVIAGHNICGCAAAHRCIAAAAALTALRARFELDVLLHRLSHHNVQQWSMLGRLRRTHMPRAAVGASGM